MLCMFIMNVKEKTKLHLTESLQRRFKAIQHIVIFNHNALKIQKLKIQKLKIQKLKIQKLKTPKKPKNKKRTYFMLYRFYSFVRFAL